MALLQQILSTVVGPELDHRVELLCAVYTESPPGCRLPALHLWLPLLLREPEALRQGLHERLFAPDDKALAPGPVSNGFAAGAATVAA